MTACERCVGRGWVLPPAGGQWPVPCPRCRGSARELTLCGIARVIDENRTALYRLRDLKAGPKSSARLLDKLAELAER